MTGSAANDEREAHVETSVVASEDDLVQTFSGRPCPAQEVGGKDHVFPAGCMVGVLEENAGCAEGLDTVGPHEASSTGAVRALSLVHIAELYAAQQALEGALVAPVTLKALTDPQKRPSWELLTQEASLLASQVPHTVLADGGVRWIVVGDFVQAGGSHNSETNLRESRDVSASLLQTLTDLIEK